MAVQSAVIQPVRRTRDMPATAWVHLVFALSAPAFLYGLFALLLASC